PAGHPGLGDGGRGQRLAAGARRSPPEGARRGAAARRGRRMAWGFQRRSLRGLNLHVLPTGRFKRVTAVVAWQEGLSEETASPFALLPRLLRRGSRRHPSLPELERALAGLYGATL